MKDKFEKNYDTPKSYKNLYEMAEYCFNWTLDYFDKNLWPIKEKYASLEIINDPDESELWYKITLKSIKWIDNFALYSTFFRKLIMHITVEKCFPFTFQITNERIENLPYEEIITIYVYFLDFREAYELLDRITEDSEDNQKEYENEEYNRNKIN